MAVVKVECAHQIVPKVLTVLLLEQVVDSLHELGVGVLRVLLLLEVRIDALDGDAVDLSQVFIDSCVEV